MMMLHDDVRKFGQSVQTSRLPGFFVLDFVLFSDFDRQRRQQARERPTTTKAAMHISMRVRAQ